MIVENVITGLRYPDKEPKNAQGSFECFYALKARKLESDIRIAVERAVLGCCYLYHWEAYANLESYLAEGWTVARWAMAHKGTGIEPDAIIREDDLAKP